MRVEFDTRDPRGGTGDSVAAYGRYLRRIVRDNTPTTTRQRPLNNTLKRRRTRGLLPGGHKSARANRAERCSAGPAGSADLAEAGLKTQINK
eukprot:266059-Prorocentrum_minimum.AAC.2